MAVTGTAVLVEYSGGLDSTLAALRMIQRFERVVLVTYDVSWTIGTENSRKNARKLIERFPGRRIEHRIVAASDVRAAVWEGLGGVARDVGEYCRDTGPGVICLGCKLGMLVASMRICLDEGIGFLSNGVAGTESDHPEQMPAIVNRFSAFMAEYGITYLNDLYGVGSRREKEEELRRAGLDFGTSVGSSSVTHQPRCALGVYSTLWKASRPIREPEMARYFDDKAPLLRGLLAGRTPLPAPAPDALPTRVDEGAEYRHAWEFGPTLDRSISLGLSPVWWLSRLYFLLRRDTGCCGHAVARSTPLRRLLLLSFPGLLLYTLAFPGLWLLHRLFSPARPALALLRTVAANHARDLAQAPILPNLRCAITSRIFALSPAVSGVFYRAFNAAILALIWAALAVAVWAVWA